jgi:hypothetical protein
MRFKLLGPLKNHSLKALDLGGNPSELRLEGAVLFRDTFI